MRTSRTLRAFLPSAVLALVLLALAACGSSSTGSGGNGSTPAAGGTNTPAGATATATKGALTLSTALCTTAITQAEVGQATGTSISQVYPISKHDATLNQDAVLCTYIGGTGPVSLITFGVTPNASAIYPQLKQTLAKQSPGGVVTDVPGLGDAAFWGISSGGSNSQDTSTGLVVLRGTLILEILTHGSNMLSADEQIAHLILSRV